LLGDTANFNENALHYRSSWLCFVRINVMFSYIKLNEYCCKPKAVSRYFILINYLYCSRSDL